MRQLLRTGAAGLVMITVLIVTVLSSGPAMARGPSYVALGDSYSSGVGAGAYLADGSGCRRSANAYPARIARARGFALDFRACSGARVRDVQRDQLRALSPATSYVTVSAGGNDIGFAHVLTVCALPGWLSDCKGAIDRARSLIRSQLRSALDGLYDGIRARAPFAKVVVLGYPRLFDDEDCNPSTWFSRADRSGLNRTADLLDAALAAAASTHGFAFADPIRSFSRHAVCDDPEWINGLSRPVWESFHPNRAGQASGYTPLVSKLLGDR